MNDLKKVRVISNLTAMHKKKNVCAYARVSTEKDIQQTSFETQVSYYTQLILDNDDWEFVGVYADEGISGTSISKRDQFNTMIRLAKLGKIDLILTKSISRFSRNTVDTLSILQDLKSHNTEVFFEKENISSFDPKIEFVISVLASMAEEESRNISENVKWNVRNNFKKGIFYLNTQNLMGYKRDENGNVYIDEVEAEIVRDIYKMYLDGIGSSTIAKILTKRGIKTIRGNDVWGTTGVTGILKNEKYAGAALLQKTLYHDFRSPNCSTNRNHLPKYYIEESHEPIVSLETFNLVQEKLNNKSKHQQKAIENSLNRNHMTKYKGLCKCGQCGSYYRHKVNNGMSPYRRDILICNSNDSKKTCGAESIFSKTFDLIINKQIDLIVKNKNKLLKVATQAFVNDIGHIALKNDKEATQAKIEALQSKLEISETSTDDLELLIQSKLKEQINDLKIEHSIIINKLLIDYNFESKIETLKQTLNELKELKGNYDNFSYTKLFSSVIIKSRNEIIFNLNFRNINDNTITITDPTFNTETKHLIRKTYIVTKHYLQI